MKPLILLHGALGHPNHFAPYIEELEKSFDLHLICFAGHGDTELPSEALHIETYLHQLINYCEEKQLDQISIFGYSMGGYVGLLYAARFPEKVAAIMTLATKIDWNEDVANKEAKMLQPELIQEKVPKFAQQLGAAHGQDKWAALTLSIAGLLQHLGKTPLLTSEALGHITAKAQLMVGDKDNMVQMEETLAAAKSISGANFAVLPATIHPLEKVNTHLLLAFMNVFFK